MWCTRSKLLKLATLILNQPTSSTFGPNMWDSTLRLVYSSIYKSGFSRIQGFNASCKTAARIHLSQLEIISAHALSKADTLVCLCIRIINYIGLIGIVNYIRILNHIRIVDAPMILVQSGHSDPLVDDIMCCTTMPKL